MTYSSTLAAGRQRYGQRNQNSASFRDKTKTLGPVSNTIVLIVLACLLGLLYLTQVTKTNAFGYRIENLKDQKTTLQAEHDALEVAAARLQSLERVSSSQAAKDLVSVAPSGTVQN